MSETIDAAADRVIAAHKAGDADALKNAVKSLAAARRRRKKQTRLATAAASDSGKGGRPSKVTEAIRARISELRKTGMAAGPIAEDVGLSEATVLRVIRSLTDAAKPA